MKLHYAQAIVVIVVATFASEVCVNSRARKPSRPASASLKQAPPPQSAPSGSLELPITFGRKLGDLDEMMKLHEIRALVVPSRSGFFYDKGRPEGIYYEALAAFQAYVNQKYKTGNLKINVTFVPVRPEQLESALLEGVGDVIAYGVIVTPEREKKILFTTPIDTNVTQVVVSGPKGVQIASLDDLSGKQIFVNPLTAYYGTLQSVSASLEKQGKPPIRIRKADPNLTDEDLLEMVNAGLIPATVTINLRAEFWSKVLPHLILHPSVVLSNDGEVAWVTRRDSPQLLQLLDGFIKDRGIGTSFGNTLVRRYLKNTEWIQNSTSTEEMQKFQTYVDFFKKYAAEYDFDYLMLVAQGYQESLLEQNRRNPSGAVGIMQVIPKIAAAPPISITNVDTAENNIHAGAKMMRQIADTYFNDQKLDSLNKTLMVFASYNAGPTRIARLRKKAATQGLDPNVWFGNVELVVAKNVGQQTVQYVSNIYKYYVAYKLVLAEGNTIN